MSCNIVQVNKRRDGGYRYWCLTHSADATAKYGVAAQECAAAHDEVIDESDTFELIPSLYGGGVAIWGAVPPVYDTTTLPIDRGIHIHARSKKDQKKEIDQTYRRVIVPVQSSLLAARSMAVNEIDAINYMISGIFGFETKYIECPRCHTPHLDRDWFAVHPHKRHLCHGCGRHFSDNEDAIGNPISLVRDVLGHKHHKVISTAPPTIVRQEQFPAGVQIWGSNPAILWTGAQSEKSGIHFHGYKNPGTMPDVDGTFSEIIIDDLKLDATQIRYYMAQKSMPHLENRITSVNCSVCGHDHFDIGELAFTPHIEHNCSFCGTNFRPAGPVKKTISNPFHAAREKLSRLAVNPLRDDKLDFRPETV
ncbi:hypothetical protein [Lysobacter antibioticus]|uniref:hypothetical protein n=1 Tax=Lysobacter antibioticus TaxID=84531 RepID=UPI000B2ED977|nr:hypothetical protein [Lysobacter antibioticus]